jgi:hypothetical protein
LRSWLAELELINGKLEERLLQKEIAIAEARLSRSFEWQVSSTDSRCSLSRTIADEWSTSH